jgi:hypothetical protein
VYSSPLINQHSHASAGATPARTPTSANNNKSGTISIRAMMAMLANQVNFDGILVNGKRGTEGVRYLSRLHLTVRLVQIVPSHIILL